MKNMISKDSALKHALLVILTSATVGSFARAQNPPTSEGRPAVVDFTTREDHQHMLEQLGIIKLRPGPSGNPKDANAANYDETLANPYPELPDPLQLGNGQAVSTIQSWWKERRPEIVDAFEREVIGRVPATVPNVTWEVRATREGRSGEVETVEKHIVGVVDNRKCPDITVNISMSLTLPKQAASERPVSVLMMFGWTPFDPMAPGFGSGRGPGRPAGPTRESQLLEAGWGVAMINPSTIQDDSGGRQTFNFGPAANQPSKPGGLTRGIIGLTNMGQPRKPEDWGALRAWAWGASRGFDHLLTEPSVDKNKIGIEGVSRYGKAALVTMAFDERFAVALVGSSGEGGASLYRRNFGEAVENLTGSGEYHWMAGNFLKYGAEKSSFGSKNAKDLPVDSHQLIALCAPRLVFISYGIPEKGDALWLDQQGSFMAAIAAQKVYRLLGAKDLGRSDDYKTEKMPSVNTDLLDGDLAWRQHDGGHTDAPNIIHFIRWANQRFPSQTVAE